LQVPESIMESWRAMNVFEEVGESFRVGQKRAD